MTGLRVNDVLRLYEGEPGGVEAIPVEVWWTPKERSMIFSNELIPVLYMLCCVKSHTPTQWLGDGDGMGCGCWAAGLFRLLGC